MSAYIALPIQGAEIRKYMCNDTYAALMAYDFLFCHCGEGRNPDLYYCLRCNCVNGYYHVLGDRERMFRIFTEAHLSVPISPCNHAVHQEPAYYQDPGADQEARRNIFWILTFSRTAA